MPDVVRASRTAEPEAARDGAVARRPHLSRLPLAEAGRLVRAHWLFAALLGAGVAIRVVVLAAYRPAIVNVDAAGYLDNAADLGPEPIRPLGYALVLRVLGAGEGLTQIAVAQHLLGTAVAVVLYVVLLRHGVARSLAALAAAPVLLDALQLNVEHSILSDSLFVALVVAACALLLQNRPPGLAACLGAGLLLACAIVTRSAGLLAAVPLALGAVVLGARPRNAATLAAAILLPLAGYAAWVPRRPR
jgi:hypothetical protein